MKKNEKFEPFNKPKYFSEEEGRCVLKQKLGFFFVSAFFVFFVPSHSSPMAFGFYTLCLVFTN